jgi:hypothetical protein
MPARTYLKRPAPPAPAAQNGRARPVPAATAVAAPQAPIQRAINRDRLQAAQERGTLGDLPATLLEHIGQFNDLDQQEAAGEGEIHDRSARLHNIERMANAHLRQQKGNVTEHDRTALFGLLSDIENHQTALTRRTLETNSNLWLPDDVQGEDRQRANELWGSISTNQGNLRIQTDNQEFHHRTLAGVGKLLQGAHGRGLLGELNAPQPENDPNRRVVISDTHQQNLTHAGRPGDYSAGSWSLARQTGGEDRRQGEGTGSYVQIQPEAPGNLRQHQMGVDREPIHEPGFITLGHELGHSRRALRGEAQASSWTHDDVSFDELQWTAPEERGNITTEENPLRAEHGLAERKYHHTIESAENARKPHAIQQRLNRLYGSIPQEHMRAAGQELGLSDLARRHHHLDSSDHQSVDDLDRDLAQAESRATWWVRRKRLGGVLTKGKNLLRGGANFVRRTWMPFAVGGLAMAGYGAYRLLGG